MAGPPDDMVAEEGRQAGSGRLERASQVSPESPHEWHEYRDFHERMSSYLHRFSFEGDEEQAKRYHSAIEEVVAEEALSAHPENHPTGMVPDR